MIPILTRLIVAAISHLGYPGVMILMAIESACVPLPSEIILPFAGFLVATGRFELSGVVLAGALGCNLGSAVAYGVGAWGGRSLTHRYGRRLLLPLAELQRAERWFARHGEVTVFAARLLPVVRTFIALPAGIARMPQGKFHFYTFAGSLPWCLLLAWLGERLGANWTRLEPFFHRLDLVWTPLLLAALAILLWRHTRDWRRKPAPVAVEEQA